MQAETPIRTKIRQRTLKGEASLSGIGTHTGQKATVRLCPAEPNTGVVFQRVDLPGRPTIPATLQSLFDASRRNTTLGLGNVRIHTVEHLLSAVHAASVDNLRIEISGEEPPIDDGSARIFTALIEQTGFQEQDAPRRFGKLSQPVHWSQGDTHLIALPAPHFRISYTVHYPQSSLIGSQYLSLEIDAESYKNEIAAARTFALYEEIAQLKASGLIKGGSLENSVVVRGDTVLNEGGLRFPNEMVRHKILDLIGDFSLMGIPLQAHIIAIRSGHAANVAFAKAMMNHITLENS